MALYTGSYPHANSAIQNVPNYGVSFPLPTDRDPSDLRLGGVSQDYPTLIELLRENGVFTAITSKCHVQPIRKFPYHKGFKNCSTPAAAKEIITSVVDDAGDKPFFLWYNIASPHLPFRSLPQLHGKWDPAGGLLGDGGVTNVNPKTIEVPSCYPDTPSVRQDFTDYFGAIECIDDIFKSVVDTLKECGEFENTLIIFTSDHGIGLHRAKQSIYAAGMHVPFLIRSPDSKNNRVIDHPISHLDVSPTVLDYLGIAQPKTMIGKSLRPILTGDLNSFSDRPTILTACHHYYNARAVTDGRYYYIKNLTQPKGGTLERPQKVLYQDQYKPGKPWFNRSYEATVAATNSPQRNLLKQIVEGHLPDEELYDLDRDPGMTQNLIGNPELDTLISRLKLELSEWRRVSGDQ